MQIEFLGTGTSTGVPQIGCQCDTCKSTDNRDKRRRASIIVRERGKNILIDCGPDFWPQMLDASDSKIDCLLVTHSHYDHVGGIDDLRPYCIHGPFPIYAREDVMTDLKNRIPYCFTKHPYPGVPSFNLIEVKEDKFYFENIEIQPLPIMHYKLRINGYKIGNMAYITDAKTINPEVLEGLKGIPLLIINALRIKPHLSHMSLAETLDVINIIKPKHTLLTHVSHDMGTFVEASKLLPENVEFAYDGLVVNL